jgi:hypothetical protein
VIHRYAVTPEALVEVRLVPVGLATVLYLDEQRLSVSVGVYEFEIVAEGLNPELAKLYDKLAIFASCLALEYDATTILVPFVDEDK